MNILFIDHDSSLGGASCVLLDEITALSRNHNVSVLTFSDKTEFYNRLTLLNVNVILGNYSWWETFNYDKTYFKKKQLKWWLKWKWINIATALKFSRFVRKSKIDIIHTNTSVINEGALICKFCNAKHVWHIHECGSLGMNLKYYEKERAIIRLMNSQTDKFIFVSNALKNEYSFLSDEKKTVLYNGIDEKNFIPLEERIAHSGTNLLICGQLCKQKGQDEAIEACKILLDKGFDDFKLFIVGGGNLWFPIPDALRNKIVLTGRINDMPSFRKKIDIELNCSQFEAFGLSTVEAMFGGIPVIGCNNGATPEIIHDGVTGFLYEKGNIQQLANLIEMLAINKNLSSCIGAAAQSYALNNFSLHNHINSLVEIYEEMLADNN